MLEYLPNNLSFSLYHKEKSKNAHSGENIQCYAKINTVDT